MRKRLVAALSAVSLIIVIAGGAEALPLTPVTVTGTGTFHNPVSRLHDGYFPPEGTLWTTDTVWWNGTAPAFVFDYAAKYDVTDILLSVDNNDSYRVDYSLDNQTWSQLFIINRNYGEITWGMDTMGTMTNDPEYVWQIDFTDPVLARYLRISATGGDNMYSVGEFQAYGASPVPEPATMLLLGTGLAGLTAAGIKRKRRIS